jgi:SAM-dependent methyltransferase
MEFKKYGVAGKDYENAELAKGDTYTRIDGSFPTTNLACKDNPYLNELNSSKYILDFGCGVGRNLPWIMENTQAIYVGLDPNTTMTEYFWEVQYNQGYDVEKWRERVIICNSFDEIPSNIRFDYVVSTFVLQHLGYRYSTSDTMDLTKITQNIFKYTNEDAIWFAIEHDSEEDWIPRWIEENKIKLNTYIRSYTGLSELTDRDHTAPNGGHHLMIFKI